MLLILLLMQKSFSNCINQKTFEEAPCDEEGVLYYPVRKEASFWKYGDPVSVSINNESALVLLKAEYDNTDKICIKILCEGCLIKSVFGAECGSKSVLRKCLVNGVGKLKAELYNV